MIYAIDVLENIIYSLFRARHWADKENTRHRLRGLIDALRLLRCARDIRRLRAEGGMDEYEVYQTLGPDTYHDEFVRVDVEAPSVDVELRHIYISTGYAYGAALTPEQTIALGEALVQMGKQLFVDAVTNTIGGSQHSGKCGVS